MPPDKPAPSHSGTNISISGDVNGDVIVGDNIVVNKPTSLQKIFNIFKSDAETLEPNNRRFFVLTMIGRITGLP